MILKKAGIVTVGIGAALMAAAPMASATEGHGGHGGHHGGHHGPTQDCSINGGDAASESGGGANSEVEAGRGAATALSQLVTPTADAAGGDARGLTCSSFIDDSFNDSFNVTLIDNSGQGKPKHER
ncbi:hypothetical protein [Actinomycetospora flava]|uniref:Uncharacterized protein n=1 Tax=Actinomycetospora flava TaxID=3129232 RepID=A0ABU8M6V5_9PSEU